MSSYNGLVFPKICNGILKAYQNSWPRDLVSLVLCSPLDFHAQSMNWDCGFRNTQSLVSSCINNDCISRDYLFSSGFNLTPRLRDIQKKIEESWLNGFDQIGARQLRYSLFNTNKWIGATEVVALLRFCNLEARVADFDFTNNKMDLNVMLILIHDYMFSQINFDDQSKIETYFFFNNQKKKKFSPPLYLQHQGHSRLIFGSEKWGSGEIKLLILDPQLRRALQFSYYQDGKCSILRYGCGTYGINAIFKYQIGYLEKNYQYEIKQDQSRKIIIDELKLKDWDKFENSRKKFAYLQKQQKLFPNFKNRIIFKNEKKNQKKRIKDGYFKVYNNFFSKLDYTKYLNYKKIKNYISMLSESKMIKQYAEIFFEK
jgi:hypothetical protein